MRLLSDTVHQAKKNYTCDACVAWCGSGYIELDVSNDEWLVVSAAQSDKWKILRGQDYRKIVYVESGEISTWRFRLSMDRLCNKLGLYDE